MPNTDPLFSEARTQRPGARKQGLIALVVVLVLAAALAIGLGAARPDDKLVTLRQPATATVKKETVRDIVTAAGSLELGGTESIVSPERAAVIDIKVAEGDSVTIGQTILIVANSDLPTALSEKRASLQKIQRDIEQADAVSGFDARGQALDEARTRRELASAQADRDRVATLLERKLASQSELDTAASKLAAAREALDSLLLGRERSTTLARIAAQNRLSDRKLLENAIAELQARIAACTVRSTTKGVVYSLAAKKGKTVAQYEELAVIGDPATIRAAVDVPETKAASVKIGTKAMVYVGTTAFEGRVDYLAGYATTSSSSSGATVRANVAFLQRPENAVAGSSVTAELVLGEVKDALTLLRGPYLTSGDYSAVYVVRDGMARKTTVTFGTADGQTIQVLSGLSAGEVVLTGNYSEFIHLDAVRLEGTKQGE
jgi:HlyD family secretion protein